MNLRLNTYCRPRYNIPYIIPQIRYMLNDTSGINRRIRKGAELAIDK
jgi:hypothetical protein